MGKPKQPTPDDRPGGLTHNPFAALRPDGQPAPPPVDDTPAPGDDPAPTGRIVVRREKKGRGGKTVTRITGLDLAPPALDALKRQLKKALGAGASIDGTDLLLQGDLTSRAASWLESELDRRVTIGN